MSEPRATHPVPDASDDNLSIWGESPLDADDGVYLNFSPGADAEVLTVPLQDTAADFKAMTADLVWEAAARTNDGTGDDTIGLRMRVMTGDAVTVLAAADAAGGYVVIKGDNTARSTTDVVTGPNVFGYVNVDATKQQWDGAIIELRQYYTQNMGADGSYMMVDYVHFTGVYQTNAVELDGASPAASDASADISANLEDAQYLRPVMDIAMTGWQDQSGGTTNLYGAIDEIPANDADFITVSP